jgi:class 3 adenylate cyclase/tetratricopeptide (TPR) repeat protein
MAPCASCGAENPAGNAFCRRCGSALSVSCPSCGSPVQADDRFCGRCGAQLAADGAAAAPAAAPAPTVPAAERRLVSVLFADLVGFTPLSESRDPEEVRELLSRYFDTCRRLVELYGGTVEKFIGDAVMAVWGTPVATEDDAERAVRAALDLVAAVSALGDEVGAPELRARAGVLTGEAAVTIGAVGEGMVAGDLVNTAARVQSVAAPGAVLVGEGTRRAAERTVAFEEAGSFELKGKEGETPLWRALRVVSGVRGALRSEGLEAPFVGRDRELRQMKDLFHGCRDEGKAHLVSVTGTAGIGKSRLGWEFYKYLDGIVGQTLWHRGRCLAYGEGITYWALADMVRMRCRIGEDEPSASALAKLSATLDHYMPDAGDRAFVEPRLAQLLGLGELDGGDRQEMFAAWSLFFERLADEFPVVLGFEDLQWADESLLDFVEYLLERSRNHPIFVVTLARSELLERRPTWGAGRRSVTAWQLEALPETAMEELLGGLVPGLPESLRNRILERAEGVPLYAVETVRMLLDRGLLVLDGAAYRPVGEIGALDVPETLHALVASRLDGLDEQERRLLQDGAVLGKTFRVEALAALSGLSAAELEPVLALLVRKEVLSQQADPRSPEHGQYGFLQDLVRRVAYETLPRRERRARHLAVADYLGTSFDAAEVAEVAASHLLDAYRALPDADDAGEVRERAREALVLAGERAERLAAPGEAQRYYEQAAELSGDTAERARLGERAGRMARRAGRTSEARQKLEEVHASFTALGDTRSAALVAAYLGELDFMEGDPRQAVERLEPALAALEAEGAEAEVAEVSAQLGRFLYFTGEAGRVGPHLERALALAGPLGLPATLAGALNTKAILLSEIGRHDEARILIEGALAIALERDLYAEAQRAYQNLSVVRLPYDAPASLATAEAGAELAARVGDRPGEESLRGRCLIALVELGRWGDALALRDELREFPQRSAWASEDFLVPVFCARGQLGEARRVHEENASLAESSDLQFALGHLELEAILLRAEGRLEESHAAAARALELARGQAGGQERFFLVGALEASVPLGDLSASRQYLSRLDELEPGRLTPFETAQRERFRGHLYETGNDAHFELAAELLARVGLAFRLAGVQLEHAEWLVGRDRADEAQPLLAEARATFERLRATPWLERADAAVSAPLSA